MRRAIADGETRTLRADVSGCGPDRTTRREEEHDDPRPPHPSRRRRERPIRQGAHRALVTRPAHLASPHVTGCTSNHPKTIRRLHLGDLDANPDDLAAFGESACIWACTTKLEDLR